jgi:predicted nucleotidyltransferase
VAQDHTRSLYDIKRDAEQTRADLAETVDRLRASVTGARDRLAPDALKAEFSDFARGRGSQLVDAAAAIRRWRSRVRSRCLSPSSAPGSS